MSSNTTLISVEDTTARHGSSGYTTAMAYGYGTISVFLISLLALVGILLFPSLKTRSHEYIMQFFLALGVGTMMSDALMHIIPELLSDPDAPEDEDLHTLNVWKMSVVYAGMHLFFFLENGFKAWKRNQNMKRRVHSSDFSKGELALEHNSNPNDTYRDNFEVAEGELSGANEIYPDNDEAIRRGSDDANKLQAYENKAFAAGSSDEVQVDASSDTESVSNGSSHDDEIIFGGFNTVQLTVVVGDALHNIADGLAIGVSFSESATAGIGTSIAIVFHEIPHEFGDFAIYIKNGASKWVATALNVIAACFCFIGLYIGTAAATLNEQAQQWMLAIVAGMFLYISLVQVLSEMIKPVPIHPAIQFLLQNIGLILGWTIMLLLALYEEDIENSIG